MRPGVSKESEKSLNARFSDSFRTLSGLRASPPGDSFRTLPGLFSDSSGVPGPKGPGDPVQGAAGPNFCEILPTLTLVRIIWIQEPFTAEPLRHDSGANFQ